MAVEIAQYVFLYLFFSNLIFRRRLPFVRSGPIRRSSLPFDKSVIIVNIIVIIIYYYYINSGPNDEQLFSLCVYVLLIYLLLYNFFFFFRFPSESKRSLKPMLLNTEVTFLSCFFLCSCHPFKSKNRDVLHPAKSIRFQNNPLTGSFYDFSHITCCN